MQSLEKLKPLALLLLRLALGVIFVYHGYPKLFGHTREAVQGFVRLGFPGYFAYISGLIEFFGGCMLIAGLFTRVAGLLLTIEMAIGIWKVGHLAADPMAVRSYETPLVLAVSAFVLATLGAGVVSFDQAIFREGRSGPRKAKSKE
ncbi:MAG TPA: DoxX family protein [Candidatus Acidoferrales bacterium]|nr:DoxX family protein [Candidatus Acidoferrales bacterium]